jgi:hypothetical protein
MADLTKPEGMSDTLWADISDDFNGEDSDGQHVKYFTICEGVVEDMKPTQDDLDTWYATTVASQAPDATKKSEVVYNALNPDQVLPVE